MMRTVEYRTNRSRACRALLAGTVTGASFIALLHVWILVQESGIPGSLHYLPLIALMFMVAFGGWAVGLIIFAVPVWWLLHKTGVRNWPAAVIFGAIAAFLGHVGLEAVGFRAITAAMDSMFSDDQLAQSGWWSAYRAPLAFAVVGVVVATVIWRKAYRRVETDEPGIAQGGS